jgi:hypothetical protein
MPRGIQASDNPMGVYWRDDGNGDRTVIVAADEFSAQRVGGVTYSAFNRRFYESTNSKDVARAQEVGESVWELRRGTWWKVPRASEVPKAYVEHLKSNINEVVADLIAAYHAPGSKVRYEMIFDPDTRSERLTFFVKSAAPFDESCAANEQCNDSLRDVLRRIDAVVILE